MYKNIILAVDDSHTSLIAMQHATALASDLKAKMHLIHVVDLALPTPDAGLVWLDIEKYQEANRKIAIQLLNSLESKIRAKGVNVESKIIENFDYSRISDKIIEYIDGVKADLIVLGTHGRRGFHRFLLGSVAEEVTRAALIPVLLIRDPDTKK